MQISNSVIQLAKERALFGFSALAQQMMQDADEHAVHLLSEVQSAGDQYTLNAGRQFIRTSGKVFLKRVQTLYRDSLDRAMRTMYTDLRVALELLSADNLALIDDETVNHQIVVDRLVVRLRDTDDEHLSRINLIIAQLHGEHDARERENPFRPYLMAHALHHALNDMVTDGDVNKQLFNLLSEALVNRLTDFYASIREVFESNGIHAQLLAQKSRHVSNQRYVGGNAMSTDMAVIDLSTRVMPGLQRVLESMAPGAGSAAMPASPVGEKQLLEFQHFVNGIFKSEAALSSHSGVQAAPDSATAESTLQAGSQALVSRLNQYQKQAARGQSVSEEILPGQNQLFALGEQIGTDQTTKLERVAIDVVAMLFELILGDTQIPEGLRAQIGRLQIPFLKAAMLTSDMLQQTEHPARQLLNRMGTAAVALDPATPLGQGLEQKINHIVHKILGEFDDDVTIFAECLAELEQFLAENLRHTDSEIALSVDALEEAEHNAFHNRVATTTTTATTATIAPEWLTDLSIDQRIVDFIANTWTRVLERESPPANVSEGAVGDVGDYRDLLPDLIWSVQEKQTPEERAALLQLLPTLIKRLKAGLSTIQLPEQESRNALDQLVAVHTQVLRRNAVGNKKKKVRSLQEWREHFSRMAPATGAESAAPEPIETTQLETELAKRGVSIDLDLAREPSPSFESDADWLTRMQVGTCVECWSDSGFQIARLTWVSKRQTLYMFQLEQKGAPIVYSAASLIKSLREGSVRLMEHTPIFERAVESLLIGVKQYP